MKTKLSLFSAYGVELEYMIVNQDDLSVSPISDRLIYETVGQFQNEVAFEHIAWSNELVLHVIELKTNGPVKTLLPLSAHFQQEINKINSLLAKSKAKLLPTGAHPWMNPFTDAKLWPHDNTVIYETYHRIFDCRGHGWSNLQSVHLNLPFANDDEFAKLHTAIRLVLPLIPSLCASTPIVDGKKTGLLDTRLEFYRLNQQKIPSVTGDIVPEIVFSEAEYTQNILEKMYQDIAPYDPEDILQEEWLNSRGAIARFERNTIEIRLIDTQECPKADMAIISFLVAILKGLIEGRWASFAEQISWDTKRLQHILLNSVKQGMRTVIEPEFAHLFGCHAISEITLQQLWQHLFNQVAPTLDVNVQQVIQFILREGNLAERILKALDCGVSLITIYHQLADSLQEGRLFLYHENNSYV